MVELDTRNRSQRWADAVTEFSGSWTFIWWFAAICIVWIFVNASGLAAFDVYPFLFLNWTLTVVSTFQSPLILLSQNRQNETDRVKTHEILERLEKLQATVDTLTEKVK